MSEPGAAMTDSITVELVGGPHHGERRTVSGRADGRPQHFELVFTEVVIPPLGADIPEAPTNLADIVRNHRYQLVRVYADGVWCYHYCGSW